MALTSEWYPGGSVKNSCDGLPRSLGVNHTPETSAVDSPETSDFYKLEGVCLGRKAEVSCYSRMKQNSYPLHFTADRVEMPRGNPSQP